MAKPELGSKRACVSCSARFYDLTRAPAVCPKCGTEQPIEPVRVARPSRGLSLDRRLRKAEAVPAHAEAELDAPEIQESEVEDAADEEAPDDDATDEDTDEGSADEDRVTVDEEEELPTAPV